MDSRLYEKKILQLERSLTFLLVRQRGKTGRSGEDIDDIAAFVGLAFKKDVCEAVEEFVKSNSAAVPCIWKMYQQRRFLVLVHSSMLFFCFFVLFFFFFLSLLICFRRSPH